MKSTILILLCLLANISFGQIETENYKTARKKNISIIPGEVCSNSGRFKNYIRLGCGSLYNKDMEQGIKTLGNSI